MLKKIKNVFSLLISMLVLLPVSIGITAISVSAVEAKTDLISMHELESDNIRVIEDGITDSYGKSYSSNILRFSTGDDAYAIYDLNGVYSKFEGTIVCPNNTGSDAVMDVGIFADGELVYSLTGYTRQKAAESVSIDLSGVGELAIKTAKTDGWNSYLCFVDSYFVKADSVSVYPNRATLSDLVVIDSSACKTSNRLFWDSFGDVHNEWTRFSCGDKGYILYNLDKKYISFSGCIASGGNTGNDAVMDIEFFLDDKPVFSKESIKRTTKPINFDIDVSNASVLKITTTKKDGWPSYLYVTDSILKAHEHTLGEWEIEKEATCTEPGKKIQKCSECGETINTESIPATGHTPNGKWEYLEEGKCKKVQFCTVCGDVAIEQTSNEIEHSPSDDWVITKEATCNNEGERVQYCKICGEPTSIEVIPTTEHDYGNWETKSGSIWNNPIVKERVCKICGNVERIESSPTSWLKPLVVALFIILFGGLAVILVTLKMNGLPLELASVKKLFSKETLSDTDIDKLLNKPDNKI